MPLAKSSLGLLRLVLIQREFFHGFPSFCKNIWFIGLR